MRFSITGTADFNSPFEAAWNQSTGFSSSISTKSKPNLCLRCVQFSSPLKLRRMSIKRIGKNRIDNKMRYISIRSFCSSSRDIYDNFMLYGYRIAKACTMTLKCWNRSHSKILVLLGILVTYLSFKMLVGNYYVSQLL